eukprot:1142431-Pelagomonas_calceolata.AAC.15
MTVVAAGMQLPGMGGAGGAPFDFSALQQALNVGPPAALCFGYATARVVLLSALHDPAIKQMAEQIATDPTFKSVTETLQAQFGNMFQQQGGSREGGGAGGEGAAPGPEAFDPSKYMQAMTGMFQNEEFMKMAEQLGKSIIEVGSLDGLRPGLPLQLLQKGGTPQNLSSFWSILYRMH